MTMGRSVSVMAEAISNPKRLYLLRKFIERKELNWKEIVRLMEEEFQIRLNPNTVSFHLKYLMDRGLITKAGNRYIFNEEMEEAVKKLVS